MTSGLRQSKWNTKKERRQYRVKLCYCPKKKKKIFFGNVLKEP